MNADIPSMLTVAELRSHTLTAVVQREIERMILSGELAPGERLNEKIVADQLMVSRGPVREACRALAELGLVYLVPNRGVFVKQLLRADAIEVFDLRAGLTGLACSLLSQTLTAPVQAQLDVLVADMEVAAENSDFAQFHALNLEFHDLIVRATENSRLMKMYRALVKEFQLFRTHGPAQRESLLQSNREHAEILMALKTKNAAQSYEACFRHVISGKNRMLLALDGVLAGPAETPQSTRGNAVS
jgi:DNA-binding GntR family transcriptional regulator